MDNIKNKYLQKKAKEIYQKQYPNPEIISDLKAFFVSSKIFQKDLAKEIGVSASTITDYLKQKRRKNGWFMLEKKIKNYLDKKVNTQEIKTINQQVEPVFDYQEDENVFYYHENQPFNYLQLQEPVYNQHIESIFNYKYVEQPFNFKPVQYIHNYQEIQYNYNYNK